MGGLEARLSMGNMPCMDPHRRPPVLDMTPEGEFRDPAPQRASTLDRLLGRIGGAAILVAVVAGGLVLAAAAVTFAALLLPVLIVAGLVGAGSIWWRLRRARKQGRPVPFVVIRR
jgi:hypothetical protein